MRRNKIMLNKNYLIKPREAVEILRVNSRTIYKMIKRKIIYRGSWN